MPEFANPFSGMVPRKLTRDELIRAIRLNITAEHEAIHLYMAHADAADDPLARKVLIDVANEERQHVGEFQRLLSILAPDEDMFIGDGVREVEEMRAELIEAGPSDAELTEAQEKADEAEYGDTGDGDDGQEAVESGIETAVEIEKETSDENDENDIRPVEESMGLTIGSLIGR